jgi:hypothetical protein
MHTHFFSGTAAVGTFLSVLVLGTAWKLAWHAIASRSTNPAVLSIAKAALFQYN